MTPLTRKDVDRGDHTIEQILALLDERDALTAELEQARVLAHETVRQCETLEAELAQCRRERDEARLTMKAMQDFNRGLLETMQAERDAARAQAREWEQTLLPFWDGTKPSPSAPEQVRRVLAEARAQVAMLREALAKTRYTLRLRSEVWPQVVADELDAALGDEPELDAALAALDGVLVGPSGDSNG